MPKINENFIIKNVFCEIIATKIRKRENENRTCIKFYDIYIITFL